MLLEPQKYFSIYEIRLFCLEMEIEFLEGAESITSSTLIFDSGLHLCWSESSQKAFSSQRKAFAPKIVFYFNQTFYFYHDLHEMFLNSINLVDKKSHAADWMTLSNDNWAEKAFDYCRKNAK